MTSNNCLYFIKFTLKDIRALFSISVLWMCVDGREHVQIFALDYDEQ